MNAHDDPRDVTDLRQRAEALFQQASTESFAAMSPADIQRTLHDLRVHQIELEMQNEELRQAQAELGMARTRYFNLFDLAPVGYCTLSVEGVIREANLTAATLLGVIRTVLVTRPISRFIDHADQDLYYRHHQHLITTGTPQAFELRLTKPGGESFWAHLSTSVANEADGTLVHRVVISDVSTRKTAELETHEAKRRLEAMFQGARDAIILADPTSGAVIDVNHQAETLLGRSRQHLIGMHQSLLHPADLRNSLQVAFARHAAGDSGQVETAVLHQDGSRIPVEITSSVITLSDGRRLVMGLFRDIRDRVRLQEQLHQAEKMVAIGELAAGVAHEINTPVQFIADNLRFLGDSLGDLTSVLGAHGKLLAAARSGALSAEIIASTDAAAKRADVGYLAEEIPKALAQSLEGVTRVADIVRAMKEFSHPDQGEKKPTDLNKAIATTLIVARNEYKYVADLVTDFDPELPPVPCIVGEFNQVVVNLLVNAAHAIGDVIATTGGKGVITISTKAVGDQVEVRIRDSGTGIPESARSKIFTPFFTTKAAGKGTGQGLSIAHTVIAKKHGGTLTFETELGKGTTFLIRLPITP